MTGEIERETKTHVCIYKEINQTAPLVDRKLLKQNGRRTITNASTIILTIKKEMTPTIQNSLT